MYAIRGSDAAKYGFGSPSTKGNIWELMKCSCSRARQALIRAAAVFARDAGIAVPPRVGPEVFVTHWIDANMPTTLVAATE